MREKVRDVGPYQVLYRDPDTGIAWVENGSTGTSHSVHPNIDASGSVKGIKDLRYWGAEDRTVQSHGFIFNIDRTVIDDDLDALAAAECRCGGKH